MALSTSLILPARLWTRLLILLTGLALASTVQAQTITGPDQFYVDRTGTGTGPNTTYAGRNGAGPIFRGVDLGTYDLAADPAQILYLNGGQIITQEPTNYTFTAATLFYRIFPENNAGATVFASIDLGQGTVTTNADGTTTRQFITDNANINLVAGVSAAGTYTVEAYLQATYTPTGGTTTNNLIDRFNVNLGTNYQASFSVTGERPNTTVWNGLTSDNWFDPANWSKGVPSKTIDAFIQYPAPNSKASYPKVYSNGRYQLPQFNPGTTDLYTGPVYNNTTGSPYGIAEAQNMSFGGTSAGQASAELTTGVLVIYGDLTNTYDNLVQDANTVLVFGGVNQNITGGSFKTVEIAGGGTKSLSGDLNISTELRFGSTSTSIGGKGIVATAPSNSIVTLNSNNTIVAPITGEDDNGYVQGLLSTRALALLGQKQTFGGIGLDLTFTGAYPPGFVTVKRTTGAYYSAGTVSPAISIKRYFTVLPDNPSSDSNPLSADVIFHYLDVERQNIGANNASIPDAPTNVLTLFRSATGTSFVDLRYDARDAGGNTLTKYGVTVFNIFTLGDETRPLPVTLVAFDAKRLGDNTLLTWATSMERNSQGFEVQVSTNGVTFHTLGFIASNSRDSDKRLNYSYTDTEANKTGVRYYRLRQVDVDGQADYSPVRAVSYAAAGNVAALSAYPNPFSGDQIKLALQSGEAGPASLRITDLMGREVSNQRFQATKGVTEVSIDQAAQLVAGSYLAQITAPSGEVKTVRIQKQ